MKNVFNRLADLPYAEHKRSKRVPSSLQIFKVQSIQSCLISYKWKKLSYHICHHLYKTVHSSLLLLWALWSGHTRQVGVHSVADTVLTVHWLAHAPGHQKSRQGVQGTLTTVLDDLDQTWAKAGPRAGSQHLSRIVSVTDCCLYSQEVHILSTTGLRKACRTSFSIAVFHMFISFMLY